MIKDTSDNSPWQHLHPGWFSMVMGLCGLTLLWQAAAQPLGPAAARVAQALAWVTFALFLGLLLASLVRVVRYPQALREDLQHPVRHAFVAAVSVSFILIGTVGVQVLGAHRLWDIIWHLGCVLQFMVTVWVMQRWLAPKGFAWPGITPVLFIPVVGNVVAPLAGVTLGHPNLAAAQYGIGVFFWPIVATLLIVRLGTIGPWPDRLMPAIFISIAPPAVAGLAGLRLGMPVVLAWTAWGIAIFSLAWSLSQLRRLREIDFGLPFWALSFPLAAISILTLQLGEQAETGHGFDLLVHGLGLLLLVVTTMVVAGLLLATLRTAFAGRLLVAEPAFPATSISATPSGSQPARQSAPR